MLKPIVAPTLCPECIRPLTVHTDSRSQVTTSWCTNVECKGRVQDMLTFVASRDVLEIDGLGPELAEKLVAGGYVLNLSDLVEFATDAFLTIEKIGEEKFAALMAKKGFPGAMTARMVLSIAQVKTAPWHKWITALGIPMIGNRLSKTLAEVLKLKETDFDSLPALLQRLESLEIPGFGFHKTNEILAAARDERFKLICGALYAAGVRPAPPKTISVLEEAPLQGVAFVITGDFPDVGSRDFITTQLVRLGAISKSGVTKKSNLLIVGVEPGSSKLRKAEELNVKQADTEWLIDLFKKYGIEVASGGIEVEDAE